MDDMSVLEPASTQVSYRGETLQITPIKVGQIPRFLRVARPLFGVLAGGVGTSPGGAAGGVSVLDMVALIEQHGEAIIEAAAIACGKPPEWVEGGELDELVNLVRVVIEVNGDFFTRKVVPLLAGSPESQA